MALTLSRCYAHIQHALHGRNPSAQIAPLEIVNVAGKHVCNMLDWAWLERPATDLDFVAGQSYVTLPSDFGKVIDIRTQAITSAFQMVSLADFNERSTYDIASTLDTYGAIVYSSGVARLEVFPEPTSSATAALRLFYKGAWVDADDDTDDLTTQFPPFMEPLFLEAVRAFAVGWEEDGLDVMLERLMRGRAFADAAQADQGVQGEYGRITGGSVRARRGYGTNCSPWQVDEPS